MAVAILATLLGLAAGAGWAIFQLYGPDVARAQLERALTAALERPARVGSVTFRAWPVGLRIGEVTIATGPRPEEGSLVRLDHADLRPRIESLWRRQLVVAIALAGLDVTSTGSGEAGAGLAALAMPDRFAVGPVTVRLGAIHLAGGHIVHRNPAAGWTVEVTGIEADAHPEPGVLALSARAAAFGVQAPGVRERVEQLHAEARVRPGEISVQAARFRWEGHEVQVSGRLRQPSSGIEVRARIRGAVALGPLAARAGLTRDAAGLARFDTTLAGPLGALRVDGDVTVPDLRVGALRVRDLRLRGGFADGTLAVPDIRADLFGRPVRAALTVNPGAGPGARRVALTLTGLQLPGLLSALGPGTVAAEARLAGGRLALGPVAARWADARLDLGGRLDPGRSLALRASADVDLGVLARAAGAAPVAGRVRVTAETTGPWARPGLAGQLEVGPLRLGAQPVDRVAARYRIEGADGVSRWGGTIEAARFTAAAVPIDDLRAAFALDGTRLDLRRLTARVASVPVSLRGTWTWAGAGRIEGDLGPTALAALPGLPAGLGLTGTGTGRVEATLRGATVAATGAIGLSDVALGDVPLGAGTLDVRVSGREVRAELAFPTRRLSVTAGGRVETGGVVSARGRVATLDLAPIVRRLAPAVAPHVRATISARVEAAIPVDRPEAARLTAWIEPDELVIAGERWTPGAPAVVRWDGGQLRLDQLQLGGPYGRLAASGATEPGGGRVAIRLDEARLPPPLDRLGRGHAEATARLTRTGLEDISLRARWPAGALEAGGRVPFEAAMALRGRWSGDVAEVLRGFGLSGVTGHAVVSAEVHGPWRAPAASGRIEMPTLGVAGVTLAPVTVPFRLTPTALQIDGAAARVGRDPISLDGRASWAEGWRGQGTVAAPTLTVGAWSITALRASLGLDTEGLVVTDAGLHIAGLPVRATGAWAWRGGGRLDGRLGPVSLAALPGVPPALGLAGTATGRFQATLRSLDDVAATSAVRLGEVRVTGVPLGDGTLDVALHGRALHVQLGLPDWRLSATADGPARAGAVMAVQARVERLAIAELWRRFGPAGAPAVAGHVSARLAADVPVDRPTASRGRLRVEPLRLIVAGETLVGRGPVVARWDPSGVRVEGFSLEGRAGMVSGAGAWRTDGGLDGRLHGKIPLAGLATLRPEVEEAGGTLDVTATLTGTTAGPVVEGEATVRRGSLRLRGYPEAVRDIEARLTGSPAGIRLVDARAALGSGVVTATGEAALAGGGLGAYRVALGVQRVALAPLDGLSTLWNGDLELAGRGARAQLTGELRLVRGSYTRELAPPAGRPVRAAGAPAATGFALPLRVLVKLDDNLVVRNRTARLRIGGTLSVEGSTARPAVLGALETREGTVVFRDRRFTIVTATARFLDPRRIDPFLDAVATARIRDYDVTVRVSGRADAVELRLRSSPPLSEADLLALVAFGVTRAELERSPTGVVAEEAARVVVRDLLGFEGFGPLGAAGAGESGGPRLQVGTDVGQRTTLGEQGFETQETQRVRVEYELVGPLSVVGERGLRGGYAVDLVLRLRFR